MCFKCIYGDTNIRCIFLWTETNLLHMIAFLFRLEPVRSDLTSLLLKVHACGWYYWWLQIRSCCHRSTIFMQLLWQKDILKYFAFYLKSNSLVECLDVRQKGCVLQLSSSLRNKQINQHLLFYVKQGPRATFSLFSQIKQTAESLLQPPSITSSISNRGEIVNKNCVCLLIVYDFWAVQSSDSDHFIHLIPFLVPLNFTKDHRHCCCRICGTATAGPMCFLVDKSTMFRFIFIPFRDRQQ